HFSFSMFCRHSQREHNAALTKESNERGMARLVVIEALVLYRPSPFRARVRGGRLCLPKP
ncbi:MAG: hypothetical protein WBW13_24345, partial [Pseudolabrys sp.]